MKERFGNAWDVDCEVTNGGFNQYFFNNPSRPTNIVLESYRMLGAKEHASIFQAALEARRFVAESHVDVLKVAKGRTEDILAGFSRSYIDNRGVGIAAAVGAEGGEQSGR